MKDQTKAYILILISIALIGYGFYMDGLQERNFNGTQWSYQGIAIDTTQCNEKLKGEKK